ncbi:MAG: hypothetical protein EBZ49_00995 [Proteobacteria bacterium]|nr:hypothetical protein [Pseudomonadota bacterium]
MKRYFAMTAIAVAISGCSFNDKFVKVQEAPIQQKVPEWFATEPPKDIKDIIVTATDSSRDMQFAIDKAMMNARVELANRINIKVNSMVTESVSEDGSSKMKDAEREVERISKTVTNQSLSMYTREKLLIVKEEDGYRAYVMLKLNVDQSRKLLDNERKGYKDRDEKLEELDKAVIQQKKG